MEKVPPRVPYSEENMMKYPNSSLQLEEKKHDEMPSRVPIHMRKSDEVPSRMPFQWRICNAVPYRVPIPVRNHDEFP